MRHPLDVVEGMQIVQELKGFGTPEGMRALARLAVGHAVRAAVETLLAADVTTSDIRTALGLLRHPLRLVATLRS